MQSARGVNHPNQPYRQMAGTKPVADYESKTVMLRAERKDKIRLTKICNSFIEQSDIPSEFSVAQRTNTYFGPQLLLDAANHLYQLTAPGPDTYLLLWKLEPPSDGDNQRWIQIAEVKADFDGDQPAYNVCPDCGEPIQTAEHDRLALIGRCPN